MILDKYCIGILFLYNINYLLCSIFEVNNNNVAGRTSTILLFIYITVLFIKEIDRIACHQVERVICLYIHI